MKTREDLQHTAFNYSLGVIQALAVVIVLCAIISFLMKALSIGMDDSDTSRWERSGLRIHTDAKTGVQYLSDGNGGLTPRLPKPDNK